MDRTGQNDARLYDWLADTSINASSVLHIFNQVNSDGNCTRQSTKPPRSTMPYTKLVKNTGLETSVRMR